MAFRALIVRADGDRERVGRTRRALEAADVTTSDAGPDLAESLAAGGGTLWLVRAGAWPACPGPVAAPPSSSTARPLVAYGAVVGLKGGGPAACTDDSRGPASFYLDAEAAADLARLLVMGRTLAEATAVMAGDDRYRVVRYTPLDVRDDPNLRVLQVVTSLQRGGAERVTVDLAAALGRNAVRCRVVTLGRPPRQPLAAPDGLVDLSHLGADRDRRAEALGRLARADAADLIHGHLLDAEDCARVARQGVPLVLTVHNQRPGWPDGLDRIGTDGVTLLVACARAVEAELVAAGVPVPVRTAWNGVDPGAFAPTRARRAAGRVLRRRWRISPGDLVLLALANPRPQKRLDRLPAVLAAVRGELLRRIAQDEPLPLRLLNPAVPRDLETIVRTMTAREPSGRYETAQAVADDLERFLRGEPIAARPAPWFRRAWKTARRHPTRSLAAGAAVLLLIVFLGTLSWSNARLRYINRRLEKSETEARRSSQAAQTRLAQLSLERGERELAQGMLDAIRPAPGDEDFAWGHLSAVAQREVAILQGDGVAVRVLAVSRDGKLLATGDEAGRVVLWDLAEARRVGPLGRLGGSVHDAAFTSDGRRLLAATGNRGQWQREEIRLWDLTHAPTRELARIPGRRLECQFMDPLDSDRLVVVRTVEGAGPPSRLALHASGWVGPCEGRPSRLWSRNDVLDVIPIPGDVDRFISIGDYGEATLRSYATGLAERSVGGGLNWRRERARVSPDGLRLVGDVTTPHESLAVVELATGRTLAQHGLASLAVKLNFLSEERVLLYLYPGQGLTVLDLATGVFRPLGPSGMELGPNGFTLSPDRRRVAFWTEKSRRPVIHDVDTGAELARLPTAFEDPTSLGFTPDGRTLIVGGEHGNVALWKLDRRPPASSLVDQGAELWALAWSPDGRTLASAGDDHVIRLRDATTLQERVSLKGHASLVTALAWSPDGRALATVDEHGHVTVWDTQGNLRGTDLHGHIGAVLCVAWSPDGRLIASGGIDKTVRVWDPVSGLETLVLTGHAAQVNAVAWSADGRTLSSGDHAGTLRLWSSAWQPPRRPPNTPARGQRGGYGNDSRQNGPFSSRILRNPHEVGFAFNVRNAYPTARGQHPADSPCRSECPCFQPLLRSCGLTSGAHGRRIAAALSRLKRTEPLAAHVRQRRLAARTPAACLASRLPRWCARLRTLGAGQPPVDFPAVENCGEPVTRVAVPDRATEVVELRGAVGGPEREVSPVGGEPPQRVGVSRLHGDPADAVDVDLGPAVPDGRCRGERLLVERQGVSVGDTGRHPGRAAEGHEQAAVVVATPVTELQDRAKLAQLRVVLDTRVVADVGVEPVEDVLHRLRAGAALDRAGDRLHLRVLRVPPRVVLEPVQVDLQLTRALPSWNLLEPRDTQAERFENQRPLDEEGLAGLLYHLDVVTDADRVSLVRNGVAHREGEGLQGGVPLRDQDPYRQVAGTALLEVESELELVRAEGRRAAQPVGAVFQGLNSPRPGVGRQSAGLVEHRAGEPEIAAADRRVRVLRQRPAGRPVAADVDDGVLQRRLPLPLPALRPGERAPGVLVTGAVEEGLPDSLLHPGEVARLLGLLAEAHVIRVAILGLGCPGKEPCRHDQPADRSHLVLLAPRAKRNGLQVAGDRGWNDRGRATRGTTGTTASAPRPPRCRRGIGSVPKSSSRESSQARPVGSDESAMLPPTNKMEGLVTTSAVVLFYPTKASFIRGAYRTGRVAAIDP